MTSFGRAENVGGTTASSGPHRSSHFPTCRSDDWQARQSVVALSGCMQIGGKGVEVIWGLLRCDDGIVGEGLVVTPHSLPLAAVSRVRER